MATLTKHIIRLACDPIVRTNVVEKTTLATPFIRSGEDVEFQIAAFNRGAFASVSSFTGVTLEIRTNATDVSPLLQLTTASITTGCTLSAWLADTSQHAVLAMTNAQNTFTANTYSILVYATTSTTTIVLATGLLDVIQTTLGGTPPTPVVNYYTKAESDGRFFNLDDADDAAWTPVAAGVSLSSASGRQLAFGDLCQATGSIVFPTTADGTAVSITGLPNACGTVACVGPVLGHDAVCKITASGSAVTLWTPAGVALTNADLSEKTIIFTLNYIL